MSRGPGHVERDILTVLRLNEHVSAPDLAVLVFQDGPNFEPPTPSQYTSVRRALARLQKRGEVIKLGNMFQNERCSYANRATAVDIIGRGVEAFGRSFFQDRADLLDLWLAERPEPSPLPGAVTNNNCK